MWGSDVAVRGWRRLWGPMLIVSGVLGPATTTSAQSAITHLGVPPNRMINLVSSTNEGGHCAQGEDTFNMVRVRPNGKLASGPFVVPANQVLVVTDITWTAAPALQKTFQSGRSLIVTVRVYEPSNPRIARTVHEMPRFLVPPLASERALGSYLSASQQLTAGFRVAASHGICVRITEESPGFNRPAFVERARIQGYTVAAN